MVTAARIFDLLRWLLPVLAVALSCGPWTGQFVVANDDDFDDFVEEESSNELPGPVRRPMAIAQAQRPRAMSTFNQIVFGGLAARSGSTQNPISQILESRILAVELICNVTAGQKQTLELAGRGDIKRLRDRIDDLRQEFQLVDDREEPRAPAVLVERASELRVSVDSGPFEQNSVFFKALTHLLNANQQSLYKSYRELERRGGKIQLRQHEEREIKAIRMTDAALTDNGLVHFEQLTGLEGVLLDYSQISDKGLIHLARLTNLELLDLGSTQVRGPGLVHLQNMQTLQVLDLRRTPVADAGLAYLRGLHDLRSLNLGHTHVTGTGFAHLLTTLSRLETVLLHQTPFTDEGLSYLGKLPNLKELSLEGTHINDSGLAHLARLTRLEKLNLRRTATTDGGLVHLTGLTSLQNLDLYDTRVTEAAIDKLKKVLPELTVVK